MRTMAQMTLRQLIKQGRYHEKNIIRFNFMYNAFDGLLYPRSWLKLLQQLRASVLRL